MAAALANPLRRPRRLLATPDGEAFLAANPPGGDKPAPVERVDRGTLDRMLPPGAVHQGLALQTEPLSPPDLDGLIAGLPRTGSATLVLLDQVTDPHNVGAVLRSAAAFGAIALIFPDRHAPPVTGTLAKAASGALETVHIVRVVNLARTLDALREAGFMCIGLAEDAEAILPPGRPADRLAIVLGAEGSGLRRLTRERCDRLFRLPTGGPVASLNVSNAAAIALYATHAPTGPA